jgi:phosphoglycolate phosphatase
LRIAFARVPGNVAPMETSGYRTILWDWNGTLLDDGAYGLEVINGMLRDRGLRQPDADEHRRLFDFPVRSYYERLGFDFAAEPFEQVSEGFVRRFLANVLSCPLHTGARQVLEVARSKGIGQSILSASHEEHLRMLIEHHGLGGYFDELLAIRSIHAPGKTERGLAWLATQPHAAETILLIGDTVHDAEVAEAMGIDCWLVECGHHAPERVRATGRPCFADLQQVRERLMEVLS